MRPERAAARPSRKGRDAELEALRDELREASDHRSALAEILKVIHSSAADAQPVLDVIVRRARELAHADSALIFVREPSGEYRLKAGSYPEEMREFWIRMDLPFREDGTGTRARAVRERRSIYIPDRAEYRGQSQLAAAGGEVGIRSMLATPLLMDGRPLGLLGVQSVRPNAFDDRIIATIASFADQAVIAMENARLFDETTEALEQQTATAQVLRTISRSAFDLQSVLETLIENAARLSGADVAWIVSGAPGGQRLRAEFGSTPQEREEIARLLPELVAARPLAPMHRVFSEGTTIHVADIAADPATHEQSPVIQAMRGRTVLAVPVRTDDAVIAGFALLRREVRPFSPREIELVETFADQAAIAIENVRLFNETKEALEQQTAVSEILQVISGSPTDIGPVLDAIARNALRYCAAEDCTVALIRDDGMLEQVAQSGPIARPLPPWPLDRGSVRGRAIVDRRLIHVVDMLAEPEDEYPIGVERARVLGQRSVLAAPLMREGVPLGAIALRRTEVKPFTDKQIALLRTFADQAAIAIENVRLFNETKEALEHQRAIAEILEIVSRSPSDVQPVLDAIVASAARLTDAYSSAVFRAEGDHLTTVAAQHSFHVERGDEIPLDRVSVPTAAFVALRTVHVADVRTAPEYPQGPPLTRLAVPIVTVSGAYGAIIVGRREVRPFSHRQIELIETFARQAGIAIENVRLFNETKEALDQQTATSDVLKVISRSASEVAPLLDAIVETAIRLCDADSAVAWRREQDHFVIEAVRGFDADGVRVGRRTRPIADLMLRTDPLSRAVQTGRAFHVQDLAGERDMELPPSAIDTSGEYAYRTVLVLPILRDAELIGAISLRRTDVRPFTDRQIELMTSFADQAAIAMENVRLFNETKESLDQQTAVAEILRVTAQSPTDVQPVLDAIAENAARVCGASDAHIYRIDGDVIWQWAHFGPIPGLRPDESLPLSRGSVAGRAMLEQRPIQLEDAAQLDPAEYPISTQLQKRWGYRTGLSVPLIREGRAIGGIVIRRMEVRPFTDRQVQLLETFARQAVIAIENVRLFNETKESLEQQTATGEVLKVISQSTFDVQPVLDAVVQTAGHLVRADAVWLRRLSRGEFLRVSERGYGAEWATTPAVAHRLALVRRAQARAGAHHTGLLEALRADAGEGPALAADMTGAGYDPDAGTIMELGSRERGIAHVRDIRSEPLLRGSAGAYATAARTILAVPLLRQGEAIGYMALTRDRVAPFSDREIALVETFADQAAIAIDNVRLFNEIRDKSHELEVASRHKSEFLANMSHELRTPLNAIIGFTDVMIQEMFGPLNDKQKEYLGDVRASGTHLLTLINDILDLSKIEAGRVDLEPTEFSLAEAIDNALTLVRERAARHGITVAADVSPEVGRIVADERKVKQIVVNLLSNAVKFTHEGGWVRITASCDGEHVQVAVRDTGIGIAPEDQGRVFEEFQQVGKDPDKSREGTGLGLTLAKRFVELHGGRIWVESDVGKGSTFTFSIPVRQTAPAAARG